MQLDWWTIGLQIINFGVLVWLMNRFLYKPVLAMIDARKEAVRAQFSAAKDAEEKANAQLAAIEAERAGIAAERDKALTAAAARGRELADARRAQAECDARAMIDATRKSLAEEREKALDEARHVALDLGADFAQRLLAEVPMRYRADAWMERIEQHLSALPSSERDSLAHQLADGGKLTVVTAASLPTATIDKWKERLRRSLGPIDEMTFTVDSNLVAGAELHFPTAVLRFSWQDALSTARAEVSGHDQPR